MPVVDTPLVTVEDVRRVYEVPIAVDDEDRVQAFLDVAVAKLLQRRPSLLAHVASGAVDEDLVRWVLVSAALRVIRNPQGYTSETVGDLSYRLSEATASGALYFTASELADCTPAASVARRGVGSIRTTVPDYRMPGGGSWR